MYTDIYYVYSHYSGCTSIQITLHTLHPPNNKISSCYCETCLHTCFLYVIYTNFIIDFVWEMPWFTFSLQTCKTHLLVESVPCSSIQSNWFVCTHICLICECIWYSCGCGILCSYSAIILFCCFVPGLLSFSFQSVCLETKFSFNHYRIVLTGIHYIVIVSEQVSECVVAFTIGFAVSITGT